MIINSRVRSKGLGERLSTTPYADDRGECVLIARPSHQAKEGMDYTEPIDANYNTKIVKLFDGCKDQIFTALDNSTPAQLNFVSRKPYKEGYTACYENKVKNF